MGGSIIPTAPPDSELRHWAEAGFRREPAGSNIVQFGSPDEAYVLTVQVDDPVHGYLVEVHATDRDEERPIGRTIVDDRELALDVAAQMAAAADDLDALVDRPTLGPETVYEEDLKHGTTDPPEEWEGEEWEDALEDAFEKADIRRSKGTLTAKSIDGRDYYYLQWREGETVSSQYVGPVTPAN
jgi:hypothetical protein